MQSPNNQVNPRLVSLLADMVEAVLKRDGGGQQPHKRRHKPLVGGNGLRQTGGKRKGGTA